MSFGEDDGGSEVELETLHGRNWPTITQFSVFLENRVGQLMEVVRPFQGTKVKIIGLTISDSADCSIIRLILSHPEQGREVLALSKHAFAENELVAVELSASPNALGELCMALLQAEINIHYAYPLIVHPRGRPAVAMHIDNTEQASRTLHEMGFEVLCEADLAS
ncbi:MAG: acetolactate synthase [Planctomycetaceae bacterium]|nr:acetolactate synthase [Planctomycetaceae bacterium]